MEGTYDDQNGRMLVPPQGPQLVQKQKTIWDCISEHRMAVIIGIIIIAVLVWWFCIRKAPGAEAGGPASANNTGLRVNKVRGGVF